MKLVADRESLHSAFQHVSGIITSSITSPLYRHVKVDATEDGVYVSATDLEVGLRIRAANVEVEDPGSFLVPADRVSSILKATPDESVIFEDSDGAISLTSSDGRFRIVTEKAEDFAEIPDLPDDGVVEVDPEVLNYMVTRTVFSAAEEKGRYALNGILTLVDEEGTFEMVAADGARLASVKKKVANPDTATIDAIVMKKGIREAARLGQLSDEPLCVRVTENQFLAENSRGRLCCQLVEGQFPNYQEVIPRDCKLKAQLPTKILLNALRRAALVTSEQTRAVDFTFSGGALVLSARSPDLGEAEIRLSIEYEGEETQIAFNPRYIEDMLQIVEREEVKFEFNDSGSPCVLRSGLDYSYVVSPVVREEGTA